MAEKIFIGEKKNKRKKDKSCVLLIGCAVADVSACRCVSAVAGVSACRC